MKKILGLLVVLLATVAPVSADTCATNLIPAFTSNQANAICTKFAGDLNVSLIPGDDNTVDLGSAALAFRSAYIDTSVTFGSTAGPVYPAASVITPSTTFPTPSAGNTLSNVNTIVAAAAPTAAYVVLPEATISVGKTYRVYSLSSNPVAIVPSTGLINAAAALTPYACSAAATCECRGLSTGAWGCAQ